MAAIAAVVFTRYFTYGLMVYGSTLVKVVIYVSIKYIIIY